MKRNKYASKHDFGHVLVIAGSPTMLGAACLTSLAAMRSGAGMVTAAVPKGLNLSLQTKINHVIMTLPVSQTRGMTFAPLAAEEILSSLKRFSVVAIGPGLTIHPSTQRFARRLIQECPLPMVVDADALNALPGHTHILLNSKGPRILTPHAGEMARILGVAKIDDTPASRRRIAATFAHDYRCVLLLKGHRTVIASPEGNISINLTGGPELATAGSGDVLTGMISAFLAQGLIPVESAKWAVSAHARAGALAAVSPLIISPTATDIIDAINLTQR